MLAMVMGVGTEGEVVFSANTEKFATPVVWIERGSESHWRVPVVPALTKDAPL